MEVRLGAYRVIRLLNRGGQGTVYLGYDGRLRRQVAIKIYALPDQRRAREACLREAQLVAGIQSPKVVQIHDVIESPAHLALVMEYVPGCDLEQFLAGARPSLASVLSICADIAGALAVTRQQGLVHGDLKAGNVLISETGRVKLTDYGIARRAGTEAAGGGSLTALSPEQYRGDPLDIRSDLFALGCLLYRMLTDTVPFRRDGRLDGRALLEQDPEPVENLVSADALPPVELLELLDALLKKDPEQRPANTHHVRNVLRRVSSSIPAAAGNSLVAEARHFFRQESPDDMPPALPEDLLGQTLSRRERIRRKLSGLFRHQLDRFGSRRVGVFTAFLVLTVVLILFYRWGQPTPIHIARPVMAFSHSIDIPGEVSADWLVGEALAVVGEKFGALQITGPGAGNRASALYSPSVAKAMERRTREKLNIALHCSAALCVYDVTRHSADGIRHGQVMLFPGVPASNWSRSIRAATLAVYD